VTNRDNWVSVSVTCVSDLHGVWHWDLVLPL